MLNRFCLEYLVDWFNRKEGRKPLLIRGARQVGKTTVVRMVAEKLKIQLIEINLEKPWSFTSTLKQFNPRKTIQAIEFELNVNIDPLSSIIFFDEVQSAPEILPLLRYFYEEAPLFRVIATGSLLEFILGKLEYSIPVGRIELFHLGPLSFEEYLLAIGENKALELIRNYSIGDEIEVHIHDKLTQLLRLYTLTGGMPEAVDIFVKTGNMREVERIKTGIIDTFRLDFNKYRTKTNPELLTLVYDRLPLFIGRKLIFSHIESNHRSSELALAVRALQMARIIIKVFNTSGNGIPLAAEKNEHFFKILFLDTGLLLTQLKIMPIEIETIRELNLINNGIVAEQVIGQQLYTLYPSYSEPELYYWAREKKAASSEVDYLVTNNKNSIVPVEVKAGSTGSLRSLHIIVCEKSMPLAVRFNSEKPTVFKEHRKTVKGTIDFTLLSLPHYLACQVLRLTSFLR